jgi:hypothetical protein
MTNDRGTNTKKINPIFGPAIFVVELYGQPHWTLYRPTLRINQNFWSVPGEMPQESWEITPFATRSAGVRGIWNTPSVSVRQLAMT